MSTKDKAKNSASQTATDEQSQTGLQTTDPAAIQKTDPGETSVDDLEIIDPELLRQFAQEFEGLANEITMGFGNTKPAGDIVRDGREFFLINAATTDFLNKKTGELETKQVFQLHFPTGEIAVVMQSNANIRAKYARLFTSARMIRRPIVAGPMKYIERGQPVAGNMPIIFEQQPGFKICAAVPGEFFN